MLTVLSTSGFSVFTYGTPRSARHPSITQQSFPIVTPLNNSIAFVVSVEYSSAFDATTQSKRPGNTILCQVDAKTKHASAECFIQLFQHMMQQLTKKK